MAEKHQKPNKLAWMQGVITGEFDEMTKEQIAERLKIGRTTLYTWEREADWDYILSERRKLYARHTAKIDAALVKKASNGDSRCIELFYKRFDGYIPVEGTVDLNGKADDELEKRSQELMDAIAKKRNDTGRSGTEGDMPRTGEA